MGRLQELNVLPGIKAYSVLHLQRHLSWSNHSSISPFENTLPAEESSLVLEAVLLH